MNKTDSICGIDCVFSKLRDVWEFVRFPGIDFGSYSFKVVDGLVLSRGRMIEIPQEFKPSYFQELVEWSFLADHLVLHLYPEMTDLEEIENYEDFIQSNCEMVVLMCDAYYVEIYCKNKEWLQTLLHTARGIEGTVVEEKYPDTDPRTVFYV